MLKEIKSNFLCSRRQKNASVAAFCGYLAPTLPHPHSPPVSSSRHITRHLGIFVLVKIYVLQIFTDVLWDQMCVNADERDDCSRCTTWKRTYAADWNHRHRDCSVHERKWAAIIIIIIISQSISRLSAGVIEQICNSWALTCPEAISRDLLAGWE